MYKHNIFFLNIYMHVCVFIQYIHNKYTQYTHILCKQKLLFWMRLITINRLTAFILYYIILYYYNVLPAQMIGSKKVFYQSINQK